MASTRRRAAPSVEITAARAARLHRLVLLLRDKPQTRAYLCRQLGLDVRTFYRDLDLLRSWGLGLPLREQRYTLELEWPAVYALLPFPDPRLSLAEAQQLAAGRTAAHRKLKALLAEITAAPARAR